MCIYLKELHDVFFLDQNRTTRHDELRAGRQVSRATMRGKTDTNHSTRSGDSGRGSRLGSGASHRSTDRTPGERLRHGIDRAATATHT